MSNAGDASPVLVARVVPNVTGLDKQFDYLVPTAMRDRIAVGSLVRVPLHGRRVGGWVVALGPPSGDVAVEKLLPIAKWSSVGPSAELIELAEWAGERWGAARLRLIARVGKELFEALPKPVRVKRDAEPQRPKSRFTRCHDHDGRIYLDHDFVTRTVRLIRFDCDVRVDLGTRVARRGSYAVGRPLANINGRNKLLGFKWRRIEDRLLLQFLARGSRLQIGPRGNAAQFHFGLQRRDLHLLHEQA